MFSPTAYNCGASGALSDIDSTTYANKAAQLGVLPTLAELTSNGSLSQASRTTVLSLMCAAIAAFDLSPYTLSASQLQAVIDTLANLYEGKAFAMQLPLGKQSCDLTDMERFADRCLMQRLIYIKVAILQVKHAYLGTTCMHKLHHDICSVIVTGLACFCCACKHDQERICQVELADMFITLL